MSNAIHDRIAIPLFMLQHFDSNFLNLAEFRCSAGRDGVLQTYANIPKNVQTSQFVLQPNRVSCSKRYTNETFWFLVNKDIACFFYSWSLLRYHLTGIHQDLGPILSTLNTEVPAWLSNHIHYKVCNEITHPFLNFNGATLRIGNG